MSETGKRNLSFQSLDEAVADARSLLDSGYQSTGKWNLAQVCGHIGNWIGYSIDGFPKPGLPIRIILSMMRVTVGKRQLKKVLESGFPDGGPTMPQSVPASDAQTDEKAVADLESVIRRLQDYDKPPHPSPLFGEMDKETVMKLHKIHAAHHLSFLTPREA